MREFDLNFRPLEFPVRTANLLVEHVRQPNIEGELLRIVQVCIDLPSAIVLKQAICNTSFNDFVEKLDGSIGNRDIVLMVGHGNRNLGFVFAHPPQDPSEFVQKVSAATDIKLLFMNFCNSKLMAEELIALSVPFAIIGWSGDVSDKTSDYFSVTFFESLKHRPDSYEQAYEAAKAFCIAQELMTTAPCEEVPFYYSTDPRQPFASSPLSEGWGNAFASRFEATIYEQEDLDVEGFDAAAADDEAYSFDVGMTVQEHSDGKTRGWRSFDRDALGVIKKNGNFPNSLAGACERQAMRALGFATTVKAAGIIPNCNTPGEFDLVTRDVTDYWDTSFPTLDLLKDAGQQFKWSWKNHLASGYNAIFGSSGPQHSAIYRVASNLLARDPIQAREQVYLCIEWLKCAFIFRIMDIQRSSSSACQFSCTPYCANTNPQGCQNSDSKYKNLCEVHREHTNLANRFLDLIVALCSLPFPPLGPAAPRAAAAVSIIQNCFRFPASQLVLVQNVYLAAKDNMLESLLTLCIKWAGNNDAINGYRDAAGANALIRAAYNGHLCVRVLIAAMANVAHEDRGGYTALHIAAGRGHESTCRLLLDEGASLTAVNFRGETPLEVARALKKESCATFIELAMAQRAAALPPPQIFAPKMVAALAAAAAPLFAPSARPIGETCHLHFEAVEYEIEVAVPYSVSTTDLAQSPSGRLAPSFRHYDPHIDFACSESGRGGGRGGRGGRGGGGGGRGGGGGGRGGGGRSGGRGRGTNVN